MASTKPPVKTVITEREDTGPTGSSVKATTPVGEPNIVIITMPWWQQVLVRAGRVYLQGLVGFILADAITPLDLPIQQFGNRVFAAASIAFAPAIMSLLQNALEILTKLDITHPSSRA